MTGVRCDGMPVANRAQYQMPMIWHQWKRENRNIVFRRSCRQDSFKRGIIVVYSKDLRPAMTTIECLVKSARFIDSLWSWHQICLRICELAVKES